MKQTEPISHARQVSFSKNAMNLLSFFLFLVTPDIILSFFTLLREHRPDAGWWDTITGFLKSKRPSNPKKEPEHDCSDKQQPRQKENWERSMLFQTFMVAPQPQWSTIVTIVSTPNGFHIPAIGSNEVARDIAARDFALKVATVPLVQLTRFDFQNMIAVPCRPHMVQALQFIDEIYSRGDKRLQDLLNEQVKTLVVNVTTQYPNDTTAPDRFKKLILEQAPTLAKDVRWE